VNGSAAGCRVKASADGADCVDSVGSLWGDRKQAFRAVASTTTLWRLVDERIDAAHLPGIRAARAHAREQAWAAGAAPEWLCQRELAPGGRPSQPRIPGSNRYRLTSHGLRFAIFYTKVHDRLLRPLLAADQPPAPPSFRKALRTIEIHIAERIDNARLLPKAG